MTMIGLEIHVQLPTRSKMFCSCPNAVSDDPNSTVCPVCLGLPGSKPSVNRRAVEFAATAANTLHCKLLDKTWFSRKTYFYPDLAKNFQITQFEAPVGTDGYLDISGRKVRISRVHMEEDPARAVHDLAPEQEFSLLDYNRSGVPLIEIVTMPDMDSPVQAREFLRTLLDELRYVGVVVEGEDLKIRADANISIEGGERVEIKNVTGLRNLERCLDYEHRRQEKLSKARMAVKRETRSFDEEKGVTIASREKEEEQDYGYIFEPDLPVYDLKLLSGEMKFPMTAAEKAAEIEKRFGLPAGEAKALLLASKPLGDLFEDIAKRVEPKHVLRWLNSTVKAEHYRRPEVELKKVSGEIERVIAAFAVGVISDSVVKSAIKAVFEVGTAGELVELELAGDALAVIVAEILQKEPHLVAEIKSQPKAVNFLVGRIIKETKGKYDAKRIAEEIKKAVEKA
jgi:aspartyl-tRNA(Asn)/glutamyl-tRNA(Gln) amidotransferase subunit B